MGTSTDTADQEEIKSVIIELMRELNHGYYGLLNLPNEHPAALAMQRGAALLLKMTNGR